MSERIEYMVSDDQHDEDLHENENIYEKYYYKNQKKLKQPK